MKLQRMGVTLGKWFAATSGLLVFLFIFTSVFPASFVRNTVFVEHFVSSHHVFEHAARNHWQFGSDIIDNVGPYGYLHYPCTYAGMAYWGKIIWFALICLAFAYAVTFAFKRIIGVVSKSVFLIGTTLFSLQTLWPLFSYEVIPRLALFFAGVHLLSIDSKVNLLRRVMESSAFGLFFAMLTLEKSGSVYYILIILALVAMGWILQELKISLACLIGSYVLGVLGLWLWAGQHLAGLFPFFKSMWLFINAYSDALVSEGDVKHLILGLFLWLAAGLLVSYRLLRCRSAAFRVFLPELFRLLLVAAVLFLSWKHGMLRGIQAHGIFFYTAAVLIIFLLTYPEANDSMVSAEHGGRSLFQRGPGYVQASFTILGLAALMFFFSCYRRDVPDLGHQEYEFQNRFRALIGWRPFEKKQELDGQLQALQKTQGLPQSIRELIGDARVDEFGHCPEVLLLNRLNYRPRPIPMDFVVVTPELSRLNGEFYEDPRTAPEFVFMNDYGVKLVDSRAYLSLLLNYQLVRCFQDKFLLQRRKDALRPDFSDVRLQTVHIGEWVSVERQNSSFCWAALDVEPTALGRMKNILYKPDLLRLELRRVDGSVQEHSASVSVLRTGFLVNPVILGKNQWSKNADGRLSLWQPVTQFRVKPETPTKGKYFKGEIKLRLSTVVAGSAGQTLNVHDARSLSFFALAPEESFVNVDFMQSHDSRVTGLGPTMEGDLGFKWAYGQAVNISLVVGAASKKQYELLLDLANYVIPVQGVKVFVGQRQFYAAEVSKGERLKTVIKFSATGLVQVQVRFADWNHKSEPAHEPGDPRPLAMAVHRLELKVAD